MLTTSASSAGAYLTAPLLRVFRFTPYTMPRMQANVTKKAEVPIPATRSFSWVESGLLSTLWSSKNQKVAKSLNSRTNWSPETCMLCFRQWPREVLTSMEVLRTNDWEVRGMVTLKGLNLQKSHMHNWKATFRSQSDPYITRAHCSMERW